MPSLEDSDIFDSPKNGNVISFKATYVGKCTNTVVEAASVKVRVTTLPPSTETIGPADYSGCVGASVTFNAMVTNGGNTKYRWMVNGQKVGTDNPKFTSSDLKTPGYLQHNNTYNYKLPLTWRGYDHICLQFYKN